MRDAGDSRCESFVQLLTMFGGKDCRPTLGGRRIRGHAGRLRGTLPVANHIPVLFLSAHRDDSPHLSHHAHTAHLRLACDCLLRSFAGQKLKIRHTVAFLHPGNAEHQLGIPRPQRACLAGAKVWYVAGPVNEVNGLSEGSGSARLGASSHTLNLQPSTQNPASSPHQRYPRHP